MKKIVVLAAIAVVVLLSSCDVRTCPTYAKKPVKIEQIESGQDVADEKERV